ncbi:hypothetical protein P7K49_026453 [Saguinus oedipus]|uniref:Uncharacterized protein n=1 Tax=Saguinus oedipus TaxID=9490 RepID=A0ABQ9UD90_SAGOE|nr:hypothetical protein P7K49_026453 [Saguinus oedipus]
METPKWTWPVGCEGILRAIPNLYTATEAPEEPSTQYLHITEAEEDIQGTQAAVAALQDLRYTSESGEGAWSAFVISRLSFLDELNECICDEWCPSAVNCAAEKARPSCFGSCLAVSLAMLPLGCAVLGQICSSQKEHTLQCSLGCDRLDPTAVNILQQIIELGAETHDATALASVVAMAPGTVTVVKQPGGDIAVLSPQLSADCAEDPVQSMKFRPSHSLGYSHILVQLLGFLIYEPDLAYVDECLDHVF